MDCLQCFKPPFRNHTLHFVRTVIHWGTFVRLLVHTNWEVENGRDPISMNFLTPCASTECLRHMFPVARLLGPNIRLFFFLE